MKSSSLGKKKLFLFLLVACVFLPAMGQNTIPSQKAIVPKEWVMLPKEAYVGDRVEVRMTIAPGVELLPQDLDYISKDFLAEEVWGSRDLAFRQKLRGKQDGASVTLHRAAIQRVETGYSVSLVLTPWIPGDIELGYFHLSSFPEIMAYVGEKLSHPLLVQLPELDIPFLADKMGASQIRPVVPPVLVPGSIYVVYGLGIFALLLLIALIVALARFQQVRLSLKQLAARIRLFRNYKLALRQLRKLEGEFLSGKELAERLEAIARAYLEGRFARNFKSAATAEIPLLFDSIFVGMLSDRQLEVVEGICVLLRRCDYLRYAPETRLEEGEQESLVESLVEYIDFMEGKQGVSQDSPGEK